MKPSSYASSSSLPPQNDFDVRAFGAKGDGVTLDTRGIQAALDAAAEFATRNGLTPRVVVPRGQYVVGTVRLRGRIHVHLEQGAELLASTNPQDYDATKAVLSAFEADHLQITGPGTINGRSSEFMNGYDSAGEWWTPREFRPRLALLEKCRELIVRDLNFVHAPLWTLHMVGCENVLVEGVRIENQMDVPNCDGIDPDHCRNVTIRNCRIKCGDDAIVIKATREFAHYGGSSNIRVSDCVLETQDSGLKIGTETVRDISHVWFERCEITTSCRGCTIQLRDEGSVHDILFRDIRFTSRYHSDPWWGRGESISFTAIPRVAGGAIGQIRNVRVENVTGRAENSARVSGSPESRIQNVVFENVHLTLERWTKYRGGVWDNRPTTAGPAIEEHRTPAIHVRYADRVAFRDCSVSWGQNLPEYFTHALEAEKVIQLDHEGLSGTAAHPDRDRAVVVQP